MKLHLPLSLFRCLLATMSIAATTCFPTVKAATLHKDISTTTYVDFGQNMGRYAVGNTSALQTHLSDTQGVQIAYTGGQAPVTLPHGMIDFGSASSAGNTALLGYNWMATVQHVNWGISTNYSARYIGADNATQYKEIICWGSPEFNHNMQNDGSYTANSTDYRVSRINKLVTDVDGSALFYGNEASLNGQYLYRVGAGYTYKQQEDGSESYIGMPITGGIDTIDAVLGSNRYRLYVYYYDSTSAGVNETSPAPYNSKPGDSGSPSWVWNTATERYEYVGALEGATGNVANCYRGADEWTKNIMEKYDVSVSAEGGSVLHMSAVNTRGETIADAQNSTTLYSGAVTDAAGNEIARYNGVQQGRNTWSSLSGLKDTQQWYAYGESYMNTAEVPIADLFHNSNLIFSAQSADKVSIVLDDTVDLGVGYVQFKPSAEGATAEFDISSASGEDNLLNSAGFIVEKGASVHLKLTNPADYMREWRKVGEGDLYIEGNGNNDIFLNVGGAGTTYLHRTGGYAAYNVLVNNGSTVVINDIDQIQRDLTFGNRGGVLDLNGNSLDNWNNDGAASSPGFTIHALDEQAIITNTKAGDGIKGGISRLWWTQSGEQTWLGSFKDTTDGALVFAYDGNPLGESPNSRLVMHSIHTDLSNNAASGIEVWSGTLALQGRNTVHAENSLTGTGGTRYFHEDDWHYADARANVTVNLGSTFELGSHARLEGNVTVKDGTFIMREGVKHQMEYIEGGYVRENTDSIRDYFGLKGNVNLASGTQMLVQFSEGTDSTLVYGGNITGSGNVTIDLGATGTLCLTGENTFSGTKTLISGGLYATSANGAGDTANNKWLIGKDAWFAAETLSTTADIRAMVDTASTGVLALTHSITDDLTAAGYTGLIVGAAEGKEVHYGSADQSLSAIDGKWTLGGGGGDLIVDFLLEGSNMLVLGNEHGKGNVHLTNTNNSFSGGLSFAGGVTLTAEVGALGNSAVELSYSNRLAFRNASMLGVLEPNANGVLLVDNGAAADINLSDQPALYLGSEKDCRYTGNLTVAKGAAYRFGGSTGVFTVDSQLEAGHDVVIDGQTYEGGTVVLTNAKAVNGSVTVMGRDAEQTSQTVGTATLGFEGDNALANAASFTVKDGGAIDLMGTKQKLNNLSLGEGSTLSDSSGNGVATLTGNATLAGTVELNTLEAQGGRVTLQSATATTAGGNLILNGATLDQNGYTVNSNLLLSSGAVVEKFTPNAGSIHATSGNNTLNFTSIPAQQSTSLSDTLTVDDGASLHMNTGNHRVTFSGGLQGAGDIAVTTTAAHYQSVQLRGDNSTFSGHLTLNGTGSVFGATSMSGLHMATTASAGTGTITLDNAMLRIDEANTADTAMKATLDIGSRGGHITGKTNQTYYFGALSGSGNLGFSNINSSSNANSTAWFRGDVSQFTGNVTIRDASYRIGFGGEGVNYHQVTSNTSSDAINLFGSTISLTGATSGATFEFNYSDKVNLNAKISNAHVVQSGTGTLVLSEANASTGTLTIEENGTVWLAEGGSWAGKLAGAGTLGNSTNATIASASGFSGSLSLDQGSKLNISSGSLYVGGQYGHIEINSVEGTNTGAELNVGNLVLSEAARFSFSANALLNEDTASLNLTQENVSTEHEGLPYVFITDVKNLTAGNYLLVSGDWSQVNINESYPVELDNINMYDLFNASLTTDASGLHLSVALKEDVSLWEGTDSQYEWNESSFGASSETQEFYNSVYFTNTAQKHQVNISGTVEAGTLYFNTDADDYVLSGTGTLRANGIDLSGGGTVTVDSCVSLTGATTIGADSEIVLNSFSILASTATVTGAGTLTVDAGNASGSIAGITNLGTLQLLSGRYEAGSTAVGAETIEVVGGQYYITGGTHDNDFVLGGSGWSGDDAHKAAALRADGGTTLTGDITLTSDATLAVTEGTTTLKGAVNSGSHTFTKAGAGELQLRENAGIHGNIEVQEGKLGVYVQLSDDFAETGKGIDTLTLRENTTLQVGTKTAQFVANTIVMEDGSCIDLHNGASEGALFKGNIQLSGEVRIGGSNSGSATNVQGTISGDGNLKLEGTLTNANNEWTISSAIGDAEQGTLSLYSNSFVTLSGDNSYSGGTTVTGRTLKTSHENALGGGALTITGGTVQQHADLRVSTLSGSEAGTVDTNGRQLTLGTTTTAEAAFAGAIDGNGALSKIGENRQVLTGAVTLAGGISVQGGTLALTGNTVTGAISVENGGNLELNNTTVQSGITLAEGGSASLAGNLTLSQTITSEGSVTLADGLHFNLSTDFGSYDAATNTYTIVSGGSISYAESGFSFTAGEYSSADLVENDNYSISRRENSLTITIDLSDLGQEVTWNGTEGNNTWNTFDDQENWQQGEGSSSFNSLDKVTFADQGNHSVNVDEAGVKVGSMEVTGAGYDFSGGSIRNLGDMTVSAGASAGFDSDVTVEGKLTVAGDVAFRSQATLTGTVEVAAGGKLSLGDAESTSAQSYKLDGLALSGSGNTALEFAGDTTIGETYRTLGDKNSAAADNAVTITLAGGSTVTDDGYWSMYGGSLTITGEGVYEVDGICLSNGGSEISNGVWRGPQSSLTINEDATLVISGSNTSNQDNAESATPSFDLGVWNTREDGKDVRNQVTVNGSLISNAIFSVKDGHADVNVGENGMLAMAKGLGLVKDYGSVALHVQGTLALGGTSNASIAGLGVTLTDGATLAAWGGEDGSEAGEVTVNTGFSIGANSALNFRAGDKQKLTVNSNLQNVNSISAKGGGNIVLTNTASALDALVVEENTGLSFGNKESLSLKEASLAQGSALSLANGKVTVGAAQQPEAAAFSTFAIPESPANAELRNVQLSGSAMTAAEAATATVSGAAISIEAENYAITGLILDGAEVTLAATELSLNEVVLSDTTFFYGQSAEASAMVMEDVTLALSSEAYTLVDGSLYGDAYAGKTVAVYNIETFNNVTLSGSMLMDVSSAAAIASSQTQTAPLPDFYAFDFSNSSGVIMNNFSLSANIGPGGREESGIQAGDTTYLISNAAAAIPEPGSAALALLGLTGLAMRRRRK